MQEKNTDIKGTIEKFIKPEEVELEQEEAIMQYGEIKNKKNNNSDESAESTEEQEHLKRIKQELLAALKRVEILEKKIYGNNANEKEDIKKIKVKEGKQIQQQKEKVVKQKEENEKQRERE